MKIFYVVVLLTCLQALSSAEDPCFLPAREGTPNWYGNVSTIQNCFRNVPYSETRAANTIARLRQLIDIYAFTDIVKNSGAPWNMQVDLDAGLTTIGGKSYTNDYEFHADVARLFSKLFDAHTVYAFPQPYYNSAIVRPFSVRPENNNGNLRFILQEGLFSTSSFIILTGFDPSPFFGSELTAIDGTPINQWFKNFTDNYVGLYKDPSVRFNAAIQRFGSFNLINGALLSLLDVADSCVMTINGTDVDVPFVALLQGGTNTTDEVIALIDTPATASSKRSAYEKKAVQPDIHRERKQQLSWIEPLLNKDYGSTVPLKKRSDHPDMNNQVQKRDLQADQVILDIKTGNASNFQIIARADDDSMWWGLYTINDSQVIPFVRIVSFAPLNSTSYLETGVSLVNYISSNNIDRLIVDASANGGGNLCLAYATLSIFSQKFRGLSGYERSDLRRTQTNIKLQSGGYMTGNDYRRTSDGTVYGTDNSWFNARTVTRGGQSSQLTQQVFFPSGCLENMDSIPQTHFPADPIIITDGTCGSSCALFVSKFIEHGVGRVVSYGGYPDGSEMETSSFAGGNIVQWPYLVSRAQSLNIPNPPQYSPTSAGLSFTHHELYIGTTSDLPREFRIQPAPFHTYYYDSFASYDMTTPSGQQAIATLYETAAFAWTFPMPDPPVSPPVTAPVMAPVMTPETAPVRTPVRPPTPLVVSGVTRLFCIKSMVAWIALASTLLF